MLHLPTGCLQSELTKVLPFKYRVGQNIALDASSANRMPAVRAAHPSPDLSAMKSDFKCNAHALINEQNMHPQCRTY